VVRGNLIGTDVTGALPVPNTGYGVQIVSGASNNAIGGTAPGDRNVISGNTATGVYMSGATTNGNLVQGNYVGLNAAGNAAVPNQTGISLQGSINTIIGGAVAGAGNVISGNTFYGLAIGNTGTTGIQVQGNIIGLDATGTADLGNGWIGVLVNSGAAGNTIGGTTPEARNIISGNNQSGVVLDQSGTSNNTVAGNYIGTDITGTLALGNSSVGIAIQNSASANTIGGATVGARNVISGNGAHGVFLFASSSNVVLGNYIGVDISGAPLLGNGGDGIHVAGGDSNSLGGTAPFEGNLIAGNQTAGVVVTN
jgi:titin